jgi:MFS superfamily sulfate permease-like transporter
VDRNPGTAQTRPSHTDLLEKVLFVLLLLILIITQEWLFLIMFSTLMLALSVRHRYESIAIAITGFATLVLVAGWMAVERYKACLPVVDWAESLLRTYGSERFMWGVALLSVIYYVVAFAVAAIGAIRLRRQQ